MRLLFALLAVAEMPATHATHAYGMDHEKQIARCLQTVRAAGALEAERTFAVWRLSGSGSHRVELQTHNSSSDASAAKPGLLAFLGHLASLAISLKQQHAGQRALETAMCGKPNHQPGGICDRCMRDAPRRLEGKCRVACTGNCTGEKVGGALVVVQAVRPASLGPPPRISQGIRTRHTVQRPGRGFSPSLPPTGGGRPP